MTSRPFAVFLLLALGFTAARFGDPTLDAQSPIRPVAAPETRPYSDGSVWVMEFARIREGSPDQLLERLSQEWRTSLELARGEGLIVSYRVFHSMAATPRDWDLATMIEVRNMAVLDVINARLGEIWTSPAVGRPRPGGTLAEMRDIVGSKIAREIFFRPSR